jgi:SAM-dependent methyltransferase
MGCALHMSIVDNSKEAFRRTWGESGYRENWAVYGKVSGHSEEEVVAACLAPYYDPAACALEIGCGAGFWTDRYLAQHFKHVIALDVLAQPRFEQPNIRYIEVPDRNFDCFGVADETADFVWSFGVFCHMTLPSIERYLRGAFRVCRPGARCSLYFSNIDRRPGAIQTENDADHILWVKNDLATTTAMLTRAGFVDIVDTLPRLPDTMISCRRPER